MLKLFGWLRGVLTPVAGPIGAGAGKTAIWLGGKPFIIAFLALSGLPLFVVIALLAFGSYARLGWDSSAMFNDIAILAYQGHLLPIPLFTFAGFLLARSGAPKRLVRVAEAAMGWLPGGLAIVSIVACTFFTTFTGASGVTIIALGGLLYPVLLKRKYPERFALGLLTSAGSLGLLFFPALPVFIYAVVYGITTDSSDVTPEGLFYAGFLPGVFMTGVLALYAAFKGVLLDIPRQPFSRKEFGQALWEAKWEALLPFGLVYMVLSGIATVNEVATLTCVYLMFVEVNFGKIPFGNGRSLGLGVHRDISWSKDMPKLVADAMVLVGAIVLIMTMIMPSKEVLTDEKIPEAILEWFSQFIDSKIGFLIVLNIFLLIVGCLMDIFSAIVAVLPLLIPFAQAYGIDPLHLGVIFLTNLEIGYLTPPVGINLFISSFQFKKPVLTVYKSVITFMLLMFGSLMVITYVPALSTFIPNNFIETDFPSITSHFEVDLGFDFDDDDDEDEDEDEDEPETEEGDLTPEGAGDGDESTDEEGDLVPDGAEPAADDPEGEEDEGDLVPD